MVGLADAVAAYKQLVAALFVGLAGGPDDGPNDAVAISHKPVAKSRELTTAVEEVVPKDCTPCMGELLVDKKGTSTTRDTASNSRHMNDEGQKVNETHEGLGIQREHPHITIHTEGYTLERTCNTH